LVGDRERARDDLLRRPPAVRAPGAVADVHQPLVGQLGLEVGEDGQPADPGVEDADHENSVPCVGPGASATGTSAAFRRSRGGSAVAGPWSGVFVLNMPWTWLTLPARSARAGTQPLSSCFV